MAFGSDEVKFESFGRIYYLANKNWKRGDTYFRKGHTHGTITLPCGGRDDDTLSDEECEKSSENLHTTVIHRGTKMVFIYWNVDAVAGEDDVSKIKSCTSMDLHVIGTIRPDWYMDDRGDATDVQYLGNQHVFYNGEPRLVKQWRKHHGNQYFTMSMQENTGDDGIHWPLILNNPGEGMGYDLLKKFGNHTLLTDKDDVLFLLDEAFIASGGVCTERNARGGGDGKRGGDGDGRDSGASNRTDHVSSFPFVILND